MSIDIFANAGGMSLGFDEAGFEVPAAVEIDPVHASIHHYFFPDVKRFRRRWSA